MYELDGVTRLLAHVFGSPIAFVSLVGLEVVTVVGRHGTDAVSVSREDAFCG